MKVTIDINTENDAFAINPEAETAAILLKLHRRILEAGDLAAMDGKPLKDVNGNIVGRIKVQ